MGYEASFRCDKCGNGYYWTTTVSLNSAVSIARDKGWQVGKRGWFCPKCKKQRKKAGDSE